MGINTLITFLENYNKWRRSEIDMEMPNPREVGIAIDEAIKILKSINNERTTKTLD